MFVGGVWKSLELSTREALNCNKQGLMGDYGRSSEDQNATVKARFRRFQMRMRILLETELEAMHVTF